MAKAQPVLFKFRVKVGIHVEKGMAYSTEKDNPNGDTFETPNDYRKPYADGRPALDPDSDKFEFVSGGPVADVSSGS